MDFDESAIQEWVAPKEELGIFVPITPSTGPDYVSRDIGRSNLRTISESQA